MAGRWKSTPSGGALLALLISSAVFVASAALFYVWSAKQVSVAEQQHAVAELKLAAKEQARKEADARTAATLAEWKAENKKCARQDKAAIDLGYSVISDGFYVKFAEVDSALVNRRT